MAGGLLSSDKACTEAVAPGAGRTERGFLQQQQQQRRVVSGYLDEQFSPGGRGELRSETTATTRHAQARIAHQAN